MYKKITLFLIFSLLTIVTFAQSDSATYEEYKVFSAVPSSETNILFQNSIQETNTVNYFKYEYLFNGGGVAIGDVNNDGLPDVYFTGNMTLNRLYLNKGDLKFQDITAKAKASYLNDWCTGVTMVDINNDGWLDIYVNASGWYEEDAVRRNILFVNDGNANENGGIPTFTDRAGEYGINDPGYSIQSVFFDYDNDGDLDLYIANHPHIDREKASIVLNKMRNPPAKNSDRLYRNDTENGKIKFTDVSVSSGIANYTHTLGVVVSDFDGDGWIDIYTSNDYQEPDFLYKNTGQGVFINIMDDAIKHFGKFSMGVDASDFNNDGLTDIFAVEMMAEDNKRQKTNMAAMNIPEFWLMVKSGFGHQYMHNALQLNNGVLEQDNKKSKVTFSEISYLSGVATTDWSWNPLFADFDNDGWKDLFITNGYRRDVLDKDFKKKLKVLLKDGTATYDDLKEKIPASTLPNYIFKNNKDLTFTKKSQEWGIGDLINSNGAAYADLDLDGDLDLIINNIDAEASVYKNNTAEENPNDYNYLRIKLQSKQSNPLGIGAKVVITTTDGNQQTQELSLTRGYQSSVEPVLHFGIGKNAQVDKVVVYWQNGTQSYLENVEGNQVIMITDEKAITTKEENIEKNFLFKQANEEYKIEHQHKEIEKDDYAFQVLLPHKLSQNGPGLAVGDANGDGLEDFYVSGAAGQSGALHFQKSDGTFAEQIQTVFLDNKKYEDMGAIFFDVDGDEDNDLLVTSGSYEFLEVEGYFLHRLYLNDGKGNFQYQEDALPSMPSSASCVTAADYDNDGDLDVFIGGRVVTGQYPRSPNSYLLENTNGKFKDVTLEKAQKLSNIGMVTSALWTDYDNDNDLDLMVVGEWMPVTIFNNNGTGFVPFEIPNSTGWWNSISGGDFDNDGDMDYALGNLGTNSKNKASEKLPFHVYGDDFDENGNFDIVLSYYNDGIQYPVRGLQCSSEQIPSLKTKIPTYDIFGSSTIEEVYGSKNLKEALHIEATRFESTLLMNNGMSGFSLLSLPIEAQIAPIYGTVVEDFDQDGCLDILAVGNQYPVEIETGRYDGMKGLFMKGNCDGTFTAEPYRNTGFLVDADAKALSLIRIGEGNKVAIISTANDDKTLIFDVLSNDNLKIVKPKNQTELVKLPNGKTRKYEFYIGSGYMSQNSQIRFKY